MKVVKTVNPEFLSQGKHFFYFFNFVTIWGDRCSLNLLWSSFHDVCKSNHYAGHLKPTVLYINYVSTKLEEKNYHINLTMQFVNPIH